MEIKEGELVMEEEFFVGWGEFRRVRDRFKRLVLGCFSLRGVLFVGRVGA